MRVYRNMMVGSQSHLYINVGVEPLSEPVIILQFRDSDRLVVNAEIPYSQWKGNWSNIFSIRAEDIFQLTDSLRLRVNFNQDFKCHLLQFYSKHNHLLHQYDLTPEQYEMFHRQLYEASVAARFHLTLMDRELGLIY